MGAAAGAVTLSQGLPRVSSHVNQLPPNQPKSGVRKPESSTIRKIPGRNTQTSRKNSVRSQEDLSLRRAFKSRLFGVEAGMAFWSNLPVRIALAVLGIAVLIAFAPSSASAQSGHVHMHPSAVVHVDSSPMPDATSPAEKRVVEASAAQIPLAIDHAGHSDLDDRGCCANGHCGCFCSAIAPSLYAVFATAAVSLERVRNASPPVSLATEGPARPPKPFA